MNNQDIRQIACKMEVELKEVAAVLGMDIYRFNKVLQRELCEEDREAVFNIIQAIAEDRTRTLHIR